MNGALPISPLMDLVEEIIDRVARPIGRMLFQEFVGCHDDIEYFAFTIRYDGDDDTKSNEATVRDLKLNEHRDASVITMNINLNLPGEDYAGSYVYFREFSNSHSTTASSNNTTTMVKFSPGMAIMHLGSHRHGSVAISTAQNEDAVDKSAMRYNLVIWLFGKDGDVRIAPYSKEEQMNVVERWHGCNSVRGVMSNIHNFS